MCIPLHMCFGSVVGLAIRILFSFAFGVTTASMSARWSFSSLWSSECTSANFSPPLVLIFTETSPCFPGKIVLASIAATRMFFDFDLFLSE
ncbi:unnamed protein product [Meloidogyne enterolobii]|uniref:Uncharacterized protein n=1 Tax=Meloidogyne enterolobii TaxID=390850 RepID=A0ACB0XTE3_MELEN